MAIAKLKGKLDYIIEHRKMGMSYTEIASAMKDSFGIPVDPTSVSRFIIREGRKRKRIANELKPFSSAVISKEVAPPQSFKRMIPKATNSQAWSMTNEIVQ